MSTQDTMKQNRKYLSIEVFMIGVMVANHGLESVTYCDNEFAGGALAIMVASGYMEKIQLMPPKFGLTDRGVEKALEFDSIALELNDVFDQIQNKL